MGSLNKGKTPTKIPRAVTILNRVHLAHYTMKNRELEREIVMLFLAQLPETTAMLRRAASRTDWKLATHTLKGSSAAVGASRINALAVALERCVFRVDSDTIKDLLKELDRSISQFRKTVSRIYG